MKKNTTNFFGEVFWGYVKTITIVILLVIIGLSWFNVYVYLTYFSYDKTPIVIKNTVLAGYVMDTEANRVQGLSGKFFLPSNTSMLFVFDKPDTYGIWMKDMNFPLDIVWLDKNKTVVHSLSKVDPSTYPHVFYPSKPALYVLELRAGFLEEKGVKTGDTIYFDK